MIDSFQKSLEAEASKGTEIAPMWFRQRPELPLEEEVINNGARIDGYRNKVEFTIGHKYNLEAEKIDGVCVGFNVGDSSKGINFVDDPS